MCLQSSRVRVLNLVLRILRVRVRPTAGHTLEEALECERRAADTPLTFLQTRQPFAAPPKDVVISSTPHARALETITVSYRLFI